jgi:hypothetical protein
MKSVSVVFVCFVLLFFAQGCISSFIDLNMELKKIDDILENWDSSKIESYTNEMEKIVVKHMNLLNKKNASIFN